MHILFTKVWYSTNSIVTMCVCQMDELQGHLNLRRTDFTHPIKIIKTSED